LDRCLIAFYFVVFVISLAKY